MTTAATTLLGLALPVTGELSGTWGDTVNNSITNLLDTAVAGTTTLSTDVDVTLTTTTLASNQARQAILLCSGARTALRTITAPAQSKIYTIINATTGGFSVKLVGVGPTTGVTIVAGESALVAWNGSDFIKISNTGGSASFTNVTVSGTTTLSGLTASTALALDGSKNVVSVTNTGSGNNVLATSPTLTTPNLGTPSALTLTNATGLPLSTGVTGTLATTNGGTGLTSFTANGVVYASSTSALATGSALTFDTFGQFCVGGSANGARFGVTDGSTARLNIQPASTTVTISARNNAVTGYVPLITDGTFTQFQVEGSEQMRLTSTGLGIGTSSPSRQLDVKKTAIFDTNGDGTTTNPSIAIGSTSVGFSYIGGSQLAFITNSAEKMRLDSSGNLGLGVTPSAWGSSWRAFTVGSTQASFAGTAGQPEIWQNAYQSATQSTYVGTGTALRFSLGSDGVYRWYQAGSGTAGTAISFTQAMTLDASGNLGVGTTSPTYKLDVNGTARVAGVFTLSGAGGSGLPGSNGVALLASSSTDGAWIIGQGSSTDLNILNKNGDSILKTPTGTQNAIFGGNLGIGVTPSAWGTYKAFQIGSGASLWAGGSGNAYVGSNYYFDGSSRRYINSAEAGQYSITNGIHAWYNAPSGTAGNAITFTQAMTLTANGDLILGATSAVAKLDVRGNGYFETTANPTNAFVMQLTNQTTTSNNGCRLSFDAYNIGSASLGIPSDSASLAFYTNGNTTERARIDSSGNLLVGTTSDAGLGITFRPSSTIIQNNNAEATGFTFSAFRRSSTTIGSITQSGTTAVLYNVTSDQRLKQNIVDADDASSLIDSLQVRQFDWKADGSHQRYGFVAQELATVAPEAVHQPADPEEMMAVDYSKLVPMLVKEIQSLRKRLADAGIA